MAAITITIETNNSLVTVEFVEFLKTKSFESSYPIQILAEHPCQFNKPTDRPYFSHFPFKSTGFHYYFDEVNPNKGLAEFQALQSFAAEYVFFC